MRIKDEMYASEYANCIHMKMLRKEQRYKLRPLSEVQKKLKNYVRMKAPCWFVMMHLRN